MKRRVDEDRFPEWRPFVDAAQRHGPDAGTWCEAWTVRDIVIHQTGNAEELARVLAGHLAGRPVATRGFEEREGPLRALNDTDLWDALLDRMATLGDVAVAAEGVPADTDVAWTARTMRAPWFAEQHARGTRPARRIEARLRADGTDDIVLAAEPDQITIGFAGPEGLATLETDPAARVLPWGRRPADPSRIRSRVGPETLGRVRRLLGGY